MNKNDNVTILYRKNHSRKVHWVFLGIILIIAIVIPMYGTTWRYDVSITLRMLFSAVGEICLTIGSGLTLLSVLFFFGSRKFYLKAFIFGIVLLWIGAFMTDTQFSLFGYLFGANAPAQGYH